MRLNYFKKETVVLINLKTVENRQMASQLEIQLQLNGGKWIKFSAIPCI